MKSSKVLSATLITTLALFGSIGLAACSPAQGGSGGSGAVAATVNGTEISEDTVTDYIQNFRAAQGVNEDESWGTWLSSYTMTPADIRSDVIDFFVSQELVKTAAQEKGIEVTDEEVNEQIDQMKANYSDDEAFQEALTQAGTTEEDYRANVRSSMLEKKLQDKIIEENSSEPTDEELLEQASSFAPYFDGAKRSSHVLFNAEDEELAKEVLGRINSGEITFEDAAKEYSQDEGSAANGGDVGWDMLNSFVTEYTDGLAELDEGQTSDLVTSDFGFHIIRCTEVFHAPEEVTSLDQLPEALVDYIHSMVESSSEQEAYTTWFDEYKEAADIVINDMPEGLPYDIDPKFYETAEEEGAEGADASAEGESAEGAEGTEGEEIALDEADVTVETEDGETVETEANVEVEADAAAEDTSGEEAEAATTDAEAATDAAATDNAA